MQGGTHDGGRSPLRTLVLLALTFVAGYVLGSQSGGTSEQRPQREPTEITIESGEETGGGEAEGTGSGEGTGTGTGEGTESGEGTGSDGGTDTEE